MTGAVRSRRAGAPPDRRDASARTQIRRDAPMYARMLRLRHVAPSGFLCFVYLEGAFALGILLALAELVSWWGVLVLPAVVALMVKLNDVVAGLLVRPAVPAGRDPGPVRAAQAIPGDRARGRLAGTPGKTPSQDRESAPYGAVGHATPGAPAGVLHRNLEAGPPMSRAWADQLEVREQMTRQSAARRYE